MKPVYLAGPINGRTDAECNDWRSAAKRLLPDTLDPMARDYRGREMEPGIAAEIVRGDKSDIDNCGAMLVLFERPSVGTAMEILYAFMRGIPIYVVDVSGQRLSPWLTFHANEIHLDLESACISIWSARL